jgi:hypothetical protein
MGLKAMSSALEKNVLRPLGSLERYAWLSDQNSPKHFSITAEVRGHTTLATWRSALDAVQVRHPLLSAGVILDSDGRPHFVRETLAPIPLRVVRRDAGRTWERELEREYATPFGVADIPLIRAALLYGKDVCNIIVTVHHAIADGLSIAHLIRDLLEALSGKALETLTIPPSHEDVCSVLKIPLGEIASQKRATRMERYIEWNQDRLAIRSHRLSPETTNTLRMRARDEQTTVHGALSAAFVLATYQLAKWDEKPVYLLSAVDIRRFLGLGYDVNFSALFPIHPYDLRNSPRLWELARSITRDLEPLRTPQGIAGTLNAFNSFVPHATLADIVAFELQMVVCDVLVSNLGAIPFETNFGSLTLEGLWGPSVLMGTGGEQAIGVATLHGAIHLLHTSFAPLPSLLETAERTLLAALDERELRPAA